MKLLLLSPITSRILLILLLLLLLIWLLLLLWSSICCLSYSWLFFLTWFTRIVCLFIIFISCILFIVLSFIIIFLFLRSLVLLSSRIWSVARRWLSMRRLRLIIFNLNQIASTKLILMSHIFWLVYYPHIDKWVVMSLHTKVVDYHIFNLIIMTHDSHIINQIVQQRIIIFPTRLWV